MRYFLNKGELEDDPEGGKVLDLKGIVQGSPNERKKKVFGESGDAHLTPVTTQGSYFVFCI